MSVQFPSEPPTTLRDAVRLLVDQARDHEDDLKVLDDLERLARGEEGQSDSIKVRPAQMVAALIRLLIKKGLIREMEFLEELARK